MSEKIDLLILETQKQTQLLERIFCKMNIEENRQEQVSFLTTAQAAKALSRSDKTI